MVSVPLEALLAGGGAHLSCVDADTTSPNGGHQQRRRRPGHRPLLHHGRLLGAGDRLRARRPGRRERAARRSCRGTTRATYMATITPRGLGHRDGEHRGRGRAGRGRQPERGGGAVLDRRGPDAGAGSAGDRRARACAAVAWAAVLADGRGADTAPGVATTAAALVEDDLAPCSPRCLAPPGRARDPSSHAGRPTGQSWSPPPIRSLALVGGDGVRRA